MLEIGATIGAVGSRKMTYISKADIKKARETSLVDLLQTMGYPIKSVGRYYTLEDVDSFRIFPSENNWYRYSNDTYGDTIDFFMKGPYDNLSFQEAVRLILSAAHAETRKPIESQKKKNNGTPISPAAATNNDRVIEYLTVTRGIDKDIVMYCIDKGLIYEAEKTHNCVFLGFNEKGSVKHITQRGTTSKKFANKVENSDERYGFRIECGNSKEVHIFEAAIDLLSFLTLQKMKGVKNTDTYLALSGVSLISLLAYLEKHTVERIYVRTDNDDKGRKVLDRLRETITDNTIEIIEAFPKNKDYNEDLLQFLT